MKILVLDGNSILNRAFYGIRLLSNKNGEFTNAVYGFMNILIKLKESENPDVIAAAFDLKKPTFRHEMYKEYKAGRKGMPEELVPQVGLIKQLLRLWGVAVLECPGYEADDILGTLSLCAENSGWECVISTGDRDSLQLVGGNTRVLLAATKAGQPELRIYDSEKILEEYGVTPGQLIDIKALAGDTSDNIPGVAGVGPKTAASLIQEFSSLEGVYDNIDSPSIRETLRNKLVSDRENAFLSKKLGTICREVPMECSPECFKALSADYGRMAGLLSRLELFKIIERLGLKEVVPVYDDLSDAAEADAEESAESYTIDDVSVVKEKFAAPFVQSKMAFLDSPVADVAGNGYIVGVDGSKGYVLQGDIGAVLKEMNDNGVAVVSGDLKSLYKLGYRRNEKDFDISLAAYLLNPSASSYDISRLSQEYACPAAQVTCEADDSVKASLAEVDIIQKLYAALSKMIDENEQTDLFYGIEMPLCAVLADMEMCGFSVDREGLTEYGEKLDVAINELQSNIYELVGYEFNLNSPKQLGKALFEDLGLPAKKKTKSGYSTSAEVLEELKNAHPAVGLLLEYRQVAKLKSTYVDGMVGFIDPTGRIHSTFNQTETRTGRISSLEPNLQNIPVRKEAGKELRRFFKAKPGHVLCDADYSQIELRVLAHMAQDENMIEAFLSEEDIHTATAAQVFGMPKQAVTPLMRSRAKAVNFGIVYGIGAFSLSHDLGITFGEAKEYINSYMRTYKGVADYMENVVKKAVEDGFVTTYFGRRRYLPELSAKNAVMRSFGERVARNMPIQGTAADIIKIAMVNVKKALEEEGLCSKLILQVHDELIVEAPESEKDKACEILKREMENAVKLCVPLTVDVGVGSTWYDAKN